MLCDFYSESSPSCVSVVYFVYVSSVHYKQSGGITMCS